MAGTKMTEVKIIVNKTIQEVSYEPMTVGFEALIKNEEGVTNKDIGEAYNMLQADIDKIIAKRIKDAPLRYGN